MNVITIELCAEDRARIDRLSAALERRNCDSCVATVLKGFEKINASPAPSDVDPVEQKLAEVLAQTPDPVPEPAPVVDAVPAADDLPWDEPTPAPAPAPKAPSLEEFQKALTLRCAESETTKAKVRALLQEYAAAASKVPEDKRAEVLARLAKL